MRVSSRTDPTKLQIRVNTELLSAFSSREAFISMRDRLAKEFVISVTEVDIRVAIFEAAMGVRFIKNDFPCDIPLADLLKKLEGTILEGLLPTQKSKVKILSSCELEFEVLPNSHFAAAWAIAQETLEAIGCRVFSYPNDDSKRFCRINFDVFYNPSGSLQNVR